MKTESKPIQISDELAAKCSGPDQFTKFDSLVGRLLLLPPARADEIRGFAAVNPNPRGRPRKGASVSRVPGVQPHA